MNGKDKHASEIGFTNKEAFERSFTKEEMEAHLIKEWERGFKLCCELPNLFPDALAYLMDKTCITNEDLAYKAWLDVRTIQRLRTDVEQNPTLTTIVKICLALELPMAVSEIMVRKAGKEFRVGTVDMAYHHLLAWCVGYPATFTLRKYILEKIDKKQRNMWKRIKRFKRKAKMNRWNYFVTFTYDPKKHTAESFRKKLRKCLSNLHTRRGWKYMGVFEYGELNGSVHFHALLYVPENEMIGELVEKREYSTKRGERYTRNGNTFFDEYFGMSDFQELNPIRPIFFTVSWIEFT